VNDRYTNYPFATEHERLPLELGWRRSTYTFTLDDFIAAMKLISDASPPGLQSAPGKEAREVGMHSFH